MRKITASLFILIYSVLAIAAEKKNVVFIVVDDLNSTLGTYGHPTVLSPNIDKLASQGVQFNQAYCNYAVCNPSRSSFLSGLSPSTLNMFDNQKKIKDIIDGKQTMPEFFKSNGYKTISLGKIFHGQMKNGFDIPGAWDILERFDYTKIGEKGEERNMTDGDIKWCYWRATEGDDEDNPDGLLAKRAVEIIKEKQNKPLFLAIGFQKPHDPFIAPKKYFDMYPLVNCNPPAVPEGWATPNVYNLPQYKKRFERFTDQDKREFLRSYWACVTFMDAQLGKVINALEESGKMENTLIVFMGDHGYHLGEHEWWNKVTVYEKAHGAPLIFYTGNKDNMGVQSNAMVEFLDLYPTILDFCGFENAPDHLEGKSFKSVLDNPLSSFRTSVTAHMGRGKAMGHTIKTNDWRYVEWRSHENGKVIETELYDRHKDPLEYNDLSKNRAYDNVQAMMKRLLQENPKY